MTDMKLIRVFPRLTSYTPRDSMAFVGDPPLLRPPADVVHVSCCFTWDKQEAQRLRRAWRQYYPKVRVGGPAYGHITANFQSGQYVKPGVTFTTRGCERNCHWCLVPEREGHLTLIDNFAAGYIIQDNNFLQAPKEHRHRVYAMLRNQGRASVFAGGLDARLITSEVAEELQSIRIDTLFLAADSVHGLRWLEKAMPLLSFLKDRRKLRVYALCGYADDTVEHAERRLEWIWMLGGLPFCQLYQAPDHWRDYGPEWRALARKWSRPAAMFANHIIR